jgi:hypothetical protein
LFALARCWANSTLALGSVATSRSPLPITDTDALVAIAIAEPVTAAYFCQFPAVRFSASRVEEPREDPREEPRTVAK